MMAAECTVTFVQQNHQRPADDARELQLVSNSHNVAKHVSNASNNFTGSLALARLHSSAASLSSLEGAARAFFSGQMERHQRVW
ncbi:hypothetical protein TgHK011_001318 [Trichoderma gracile]|nr:hypothetical protein TgHK011_001318 [Trichoderma gracile]